jgi:hypothetical protein
VIKWLYYLALGELMQAFLMAPDPGAKGSLELIAVPIMVAVGQIDVPGRLMGLKPIQAFAGDPGVDQHRRIGGSDIVRMDLLLDALMEGRPVVDAGKDLLHKRPLFRISGSIARIIHKKRRTSFNPLI